MNFPPDGPQVDRERLARELADLRAQMERFPKRRHRLEFRAAELAVRIELLDARLHGWKTSVALGTARAVRRTSSDPGRA